MSVFEVVPTKSPKVVRLRGTIGKVNQATGQFENDFSGFCSCLGDEVAQKAMGLKPEAHRPVRIRLNSVDVTQNFVKQPDDTFITYNNFNVYEFSRADEVEYQAPASQTNTSNASKSPDDWAAAYQGVSDDMEDEGLPF